jgi:1-acyl-sn-glycerol-3-phosphate acyltransferase
LASRIYKWLVIITLLGVPLVNLQVAGREHLVPHQSYVVIANHQSLVGIFLLYGFLESDLKSVMKKELHQVPALGLACAAMGHILINRSNTDAALASINQTSKRVKDGIDLRPGRAALIFGAPIPTQGHTGDDLTSLIDMNREAMLAQLGQSIEQDRRSIQDGL